MVKEWDFRTGSGGSPKIDRPGSNRTNGARYYPYGEEIGCGEDRGLCRPVCSSCRPSEPDDKRHAVQTLKLVLFATPLLSVSMLGGCRSWWESKAEFVGPTAGKALYVEQPFPANRWGIRVVLKNGSDVKVLYEIRGDVFLEFADAAWSSDGRRVTLFGCGTPPLRISYDLRSAATRPFDEGQSLVAAHIRSIYHVQGKDREVFEWACSDEGNNAFLHAHPSARAR
jgi:hypothetical protein